MSNYVNIACPVVYQGRHYRGVSVQPGVNMSFEQLNCIIEKSRVVFDNTDVNVMVFVEGITSVEEFVDPCREFLLVSALPAPAAPAAPAA